MKTFPNFMNYRKHRIETLIALTIFALLACQKNEHVKEGSEPSIHSAIPAVPAIAEDSILQQGSDLSKLCDSIGPAWVGDFNGDGVSDTAKAVHVLSAQQMEASSFRKVTIDTTSPGDDLCGGWGVFMLLSEKSSALTRREKVYFCGQQGRVQDFSWVGLAQVDTLPYPDLKTMVGTGVKDLVSLFSQAGITVYLYYTGKQFKVYEPNEDP